MNAIIYQDVGRCCTMVQQTGEKSRGSIRIQRFLFPAPDTAVPVKIPAYRCLLHVRPAGGNDTFSGDEAGVIAAQERDD